MEDVYNRKCFFYKWRIENFNFCGQKTGEHLESPVFTIESSPKTSWRLWLYPRGEDDGEYISCYLFRDEGGPEVMEVDFELSVSVGEQLVKPPVSFEKIYSFRNGQREGYKSFAMRREISLLKPAWQEKCILTLVCRIFKRNGDRFEVKENFGRTLIAKERISGMEVFDEDADLNLESNRDIEVKSLLITCPLINISLAHFDEIFTIKIHPEKCEKIKFAICKITLIKSWEKKSPIERVCSWVGEVKTETWRHCAPLPKTESVEQDSQNAQKTFFLHYDFSYSTGVEYANNEINDYGTDLWIENITQLESSCENVRTEELMDVLKHAYTYNTYADLTIKTQHKIFKAHKAVLRARSSLLADMLEDSPQNIELGNYRDDIIQRFLQFLYTDSLEDMYCPVAIELYQIAHQYKVELLKKKCRSFLKINCNAKNVSDILHLAVAFKDSSLRAHIMKYIVAHDEEVFRTDEWQMFAEKEWTLAEECMLLKYQKKFPIF